MITADKALNAIPDGLKTPLIEEYTNIVQSYMHRKWTPAELSGGKFCEIVYTIIKGHSDGHYQDKPEKPQNFVSACKALENLSNPRSLQILIPRMLPALYEIRNSRGVGHAGGDVNSNYMDANTVLAVTSWIMAELIRVFHDLPIDDAQKLADTLIERRTPLIWHSGSIRRVLNPDLGFKEQVLVLLASCSSLITKEDLLNWIEPSNRSYLYQVLRDMHKSRYIELSQDEKLVELLPPGMKIAEQIFSTLA
jgi:hypothetical protein